MVTDRRGVERSPYYPALDGVRALVVLIVFTDHYFSGHLRHPGVARIWVDLTNCLWIGVDVSFVLSGFLITGILYDSRHTRHRLKNFYMRRVLRIFPLFYAVWLFLALTNSIFSWSWNVSWILWPAQLGNLARFAFFNPANFLHMDILVNRGRFQGWLPAVYMGHFWSLAIEEQFYLFWPIVVVSCRSLTKLLWISMGIASTALLARAVLQVYAPTPLLDSGLLSRLTITRIDSQIIGAALALLLRSRAKEELYKYRRQFTLTATALFVLLSIARVAGIGSYLIPVVGYTVIPLFAAAILLESTHAPSVLARIFSNGSLRRFGMVSYGFYIFHDLPHTFYRSLASRIPVLRNTPGLSTAMIAFAATLGIAILSYRYFEQPFLELKKHWLGRQTADSAPLLTPNSNGQTSIDLVPIKTTAFSRRREQTPSAP